MAFAATPCQVVIPAKAGVHGLPQRSMRANVVAELRWEFRCADPWRVRRSQVSSGAITRLTMAITLIRMFIEGPEVSLNGSPTVSPTTTA